LLICLDCFQLSTSSSVEEDLLSGEFHVLLPVCGFLVGAAVGLTGVGGGVLMTPLLILGLGLPPTSAVGADLVYAAVTKWVGSWQHWRQGNVNRALVLRLAVGSIPATWAAAAFLRLLQVKWRGQVEELLGRSVALVLLLAAALMLYRCFRPRNSVLAGEEVLPSSATGRIVAAGAIGGFLVGLTSVGSGSIIMALMALFLPLTSAKLVGTDIAHGALVVSSAAIGHLLLQHVDLTLVAQLLIGSIPGVLAGSKLAAYIPPNPLRIAISGMLVVSSVKLFF